MSKFKFTPEMFLSRDEIKYGGDKHFELGARFVRSAQAALDKHLEILPKVTGYVYPGTDCFMDDVETQDTHTAVLFNLEPIVAKECEHKVRKNAVVFFSKHSETHHLGKVCGVKLKATWEVVTNE